MDENDEMSAEWRELRALLNEEDDFTVEDLLHADAWLKLGLARRAQSQAIGQGEKAEARYQGRIKDSRAGRLSRCATDFLRANGSKTWAR